MVKTILLLLLLASSTLRAQELTRSDFEVILIPFIFNSFIIEGAQGSSWATELWVRNAASERVIFAHGEPWCYVCGPPPEPIFLAPKSTGRVIGRFGQWGRFSGLMYLEKRFSNELFFSLRIRDLSRNADTAGTAIPVVREDELYSGPFELINVPVREGRVNLRVYSVLPYDYPVRIGLYPLDSEEAHTLREVTVEKSPFSDPDDDFHFHPSEALVLDLTSWLPADATGPIRIRIEPLAEGRFWAFASVTNDSTQQVTIIAPD